MKKVIILLTIVAFAFTVCFAGCGKKEEEATPTPKPVVKSTPKPVPQAPTGIQKSGDSDTSKVKKTKKSGSKKKVGGLKKK